MSDDLTSNEKAERHEMDADGQIAIAAHRVRRDVMPFTHTEVPPALEGREIQQRADLARANRIAKATDYMF